MGTVTTRTGVANMTATHLKMDTVNTIELPARGKFVEKARLWYDVSRRTCLADHTWGFAKKDAQRSAAGDAPLFGYAAKYLKPSDYIRIVTLGDPKNPEKDYEIKGRYIHCNLTSPIDLVYIYDCEDISMFSPFFLQCFSLRLAADMAYDMTGNRSFQAELNEAYLESISMAKTIDSQESPPTDRVRRSKWKAAKEGAFGSSYQGRVVV